MCVCIQVSVCSCRGYGEGGGGRAKFPHFPRIYQMAHDLFTFASSRL